MSLSKKTFLCAVVFTISLDTILTENVLDTLKKLGKGPQANPYLDEFLDKHSQPKIKWDGKDFNLNVDERHPFKPPIRMAPFPSTGEPWPMPKHYSAIKDRVLKMNAAYFRIKVLNKSCDILEDAIKRYTEIISKHTLSEPYSFPFNYNQKTRTDRKKQEEEKYKNVSEMKNLEISVLADDQKYPHVEMDESYELTVKPDAVRLVANKVWGALRGLETFSQLLFRRRGTNEIYAKETEIKDQPRFPHRGIMIDTSRHFMEKYVIKNVLDGIAYNKMNVLHWHIVDDNSFPYKSEVYPKLSEMGAYHPTKVYSLRDIKELVEYARLRGIRVIPEFDTPGHMFAWLGYPELKATCYQGNQPVNGPVGPIDPSKDESYQFMSNLYSEIYEVFPDVFSHLGGDELHSECWATNPDIKKYLEEKAGISQAEARSTRSYVDKAIGYYFKRLIDTLKDTAVKKNNRKTSFVMWEDVLKNTDKVPMDSILQVWAAPQSNVADLNRRGYRALFSSCWYLDDYHKDIMWVKYYDCDPSPYGRDLHCRSSFTVSCADPGFFPVPKDSIMHVWYGNPTNVQRANSKGYRALFSNCWYLDSYNKGIMWPNYYMCEPSPYFKEEEEKGKLLGGEACLWAEYITSDTLMTMMWPRSSAPAERLWSPKSQKDLNDASRRIQEQRCRMIYRGLPTGHIGGPDYCLRYTDGPLGGNNPLEPSILSQKVMGSIADADYSVMEGSINNRMAFTVVTDYQNYLPLVNILLTAIGVYFIIVASRCWRNKNIFS